MVKKRTDGANVGANIVSCALLWHAYVCVGVSVGERGIKEKKRGKYRKGGKL